MHREQPVVLPQRMQLTNCFNTHKITKNYKEIDKCLLQAVSGSYFTETSGLEVLRTQDCHRQEGSEVSVGKRIVDYAAVH